MNIERWLPIPGWEGYYEVSDRGRVRTIRHIVHRSDGKTQTISAHQMSLSPWRGYPGVRLSKGGITVTRAVHGLVLSAFVSPRPAGMECCHGDGNRGNNHLSNLRWDTPSENSYDIVRHGTHPQANKTHCPRGHLLALPNLARSSLAAGRRECRACGQARPYAKGQPPHVFQEISDEKYRKLMRGAT